MERLTDSEKVIKGLEKVWNTLDLYADHVYDALKLLKADQDKLIRQRDHIESLEALASWLADAVFEEDWDSNPEFYREIICRKLVKHGYVRVEDDNYVKTNKEAVPWEKG